MAKQTFVKKFFIASVLLISSISNNLLGLKVKGADKYDYDLSWKYVEIDGTNLAFINAYCTNNGFKNAYVWPAAAAKGFLKDPAALAKLPQLPDDVFLLPSLDVVNTGDCKIADLPTKFSRLSTSAAIPAAQDLATTTEQGFDLAKELRKTEAKIVETDLLETVLKNARGMVTSTPTYEQYKKERAVLKKELQTKFNITSPEILEEVLKSEFDDKMTGNLADSIAKVKQAEEKRNALKNTKDEVEKHKDDAKRMLDEIAAQRKAIAEKKKQAEEKAMILQAQIEEAKKKNTEKKNATAEEKEQLEKQIKAFEEAKAKSEKEAQELQTKLNEPSATTAPNPDTDTPWYKNWKVLTPATGTLLIVGYIVSKVVQPPVTEKTVDEENQTITPNKKKTSSKKRG